MHKVNIHSMGKPEQMSFRFKQVIVVRTDIGMGKGKVAAQAAHASLGAALKVMKNKKEWFESWEEEGQAKVVLKVTDLDALFELKDRALKDGLPVQVVEDRGLTQVPEGTVTCIAIGPAPSERIDIITGGLKLL